MQTYRELKAQIPRGAREFEATFDRTPREDCCSFDEFKAIVSQQCVERGITVVGYCETVNDKTGAPLFAIVGYKESA